MNLEASFTKHTLNFKNPAGTSRGVYTEKNSWLIQLSDGSNTGIGECSVLNGLSIDDRPDFEKKLHNICSAINKGNFDLSERLPEFPAIRFGLETAMADLKNGGKRELFPSAFTAGKKGIPTNGLIWMGDKTSMRKQIARKLDQGFTCLKLKIGALDWETEKELIFKLREEFNPSDLLIRVDANGAYSYSDAIKILDDLHQLKVHSIEQPIEAGQWELMAKLCRESPLPIALDEELIGIHPFEKKTELIKTIQPRFIILKPGLLGGFQASEEWIALAAKNGIGWWATSALEGNIGLNAIAQWVYTKDVKTQQGLGTGMLFTNNIASPLVMRGEKLYYDPKRKWGTIPAETQ